MNLSVRDSAQEPFVKMKFMNLESYQDTFRLVPSNIVQSIRAFRPLDLQEQAKSLQHHFLYANCGHVQSKAQTLAHIAESFEFPLPYGKTMESLFDCMTQVLSHSSHNGFLLVLEHIPILAKFDREARETLLDVFRDAADFWAERKIPFRTFYSFL